MFGIIVMELIDRIRFLAGLSRHVKIVGDVSNVEGYTLRRECCVFGCQHSPSSIKVVVFCNRNGMHAGDARYLASLCLEHAVSVKALKLKRYRCLVSQGNL